MIPLMLRREVGLPSSHENFVKMGVVRAVERAVNLPAGEFPGGKVSGHYLYIFSSILGQRTVEQFDYHLKRRWSCPVPLYCTSFCLTSGLFIVTFRGSWNAYRIEKRAHHDGSILASVDFVGGRDVRFSESPSSLRAEWKRGLLEWDDQLRPLAQPSASPSLHICPPDFDASVLGENESLYMTIPVGTYFAVGFFTPGRRKWFRIWDCSKELPVDVLGKAIEGELLQFTKEFLLYKNNGLKCVDLRGILS